MKCSMCGLEFEERTAAAACAGCPLNRGCKLIKCPRCGFETPPEPEWIKNLKRRRKEQHENK